MQDVIKQVYVSWSSEKNQRRKLQQAYVIVASILAALAGVVTLLNDSLGKKLLMVAAGAIFIFFVNAIMWALVEAFVSSRSGSKK
ncbi:hypothetical protein HG445_000790 [Candidatus Saccharibacteria bacterium]|jgi:hypothetical protein|nr:hypothetical protein [Candidatus Saccharibacteria bacterium]QHU89414.1 hypothetical protein GWK73_01990 [Candidatus Saccharibacteria bacterium oral taxon 955]QHU91268.1 hypothetical protein GWK75_02240 [Candidatus Saccharibacteria bacterium oral taxon 955]